jgi:hypothetical protein
MTSTQVDVAALTRQLRAAMRHGARAASLAAYAPRFVDLLTPGSSDSRDERAQTAESVIRAAIAPLGPDIAPAMRIMLGLEPGTWHTRIETRRERAAALLNITPDTFRRSRHEATYLHDIAWGLWQHRRSITA